MKPDSKKSSPQLIINKPFIITTPEKHLKNADLNNKETPPKDKSRYKGNVLSNFIEANPSNRNMSYSKSIMS